MTSNVPQAVAQASAATAKLQRQMALTGKASAATSAQVASAQARIAGAAFYASAAVAAMGADIVIHGVGAAAKLQLAMTTVQNATGATTDQLKSLGDMVLHVSGITAQSADTIAAEMATAARSGISSVARLKAVFPDLAKFADVLWVMGKTTGHEVDPVDAVRAGTQFSHYFQAYTPDKLLGTRKNPQMLDWLTKLMFVQPEGIDRLVTQGRYFIPLFMALSKGDPNQVKDVMELLAVMGQTGFLRGKGGTSIANTLLGDINAAQLTGYRQGQRIEALKELGILDAAGHNTTITSAGTLDWAKFQKVMSDASQRLKEADFVRDIHNAFNQQATYFQATVNTPAVRQQMKFIDDAFNRMGTVEDFFNKYFKDLIPQVSRALTNLTNVFINIFLPTLPMLTSAFRHLADGLGTIGDWFSAHPSAALATGISMIAATGTAFVTALATGSVAMLNFTRSAWTLNTAMLASNVSFGANIAKFGVVIGSVRSLTGWLGKLAIGLAPVIADAGVIAGILALGGLALNKLIQRGVAQHGVTADPGSPLYYAQQQALSAVKKIQVAPAHPSHRPTAAAHHPRGNQVALTFNINGVENPQQVWKFVKGQLDKHTRQQGAYALASANNGGGNLALYGVPSRAS